MPAWCRGIRVSVTSMGLVKAVGLTVETAEAVSIGGLKWIIYHLSGACTAKKTNDMHYRYIVARPTALAVLESDVTALLMPKYSRLQGHLHSVVKSPYERSESMLDKEHMLTSYRGPHTAIGQH